MSPMLWIRGIFEPTIIKGGETPYPEHPYFRVGGTVDARVVDDPRPGQMLSLDVLRVRAR